MNRAGRITEILTARLAPALVRVADDSASHAGHAGAASGGETHFNVTAIAAAFRGQSRVARSRMVHDALATEFASGLHALSLKLKTPEEHAALTGPATLPTARP